MEASKRSRLARLCRGQDSPYHLEKMYLSHAELGLGEGPGVRASPTRLVSFSIKLHGVPCWPLVGLTLLQQEGPVWGLRRQEAGRAEPCSLCPHRSVGTMKAGLQDPPGLSSVSPELTPLWKK